MARRDEPGAKALAAPLFGIIVLLTTYWVVTDWHNLPNLISSTLNGLSWPS
jgi:hypothetical protein